jgi:hypothetical protein
MSDYVPGQGFRGSPITPESQDPDRTLCTLAAVGAALASTYWGALVALMLLGMFGGYAISPLQVALPILLIVLYAMRAVRVYRGDRSAARRLAWLHLIGGVFGLIYLTNYGSVIATLYGIKVAIHVLGGIPAFLVSRER